jgi:hypothetical protein
MATINVAAQFRRNQQVFAYKPGPDGTGPPVGSATADANGTVAITVPTTGLHWVVGGPLNPVPDSA